MLVSLPTIALANTVEMIVTPCMPGMPLDQCGVKLSVTDPATFTMQDGKVIDIPANTTVTITGGGLVTQSALADLFDVTNTVASSAAAGTSVVGDLSGSTIPFNSPPTSTGTGTSTTTPTFTFTISTSSGPSPPSQSVSP